MEYKNFIGIHPDICNLIEHTENRSYHVYSSERIIICKSGLEYAEVMFGIIKNHEKLHMFKELEKKYDESVKSYSDYIGKYGLVTFNEHRFIFCASAYYVFLRRGLTKISSLQYTEWKQQPTAEANRMKQHETA
jgi:DNA polymerase III epsilon subunit-like protein